MDATLNELGKQPAASERLNNSDTNGASRSMTCLRMYVGSGSAAEFLSSNWRVEQMTSSTLMTENCGSDTPSRTAENIGDGALHVVARTLLTFSKKKSLSDSTSRDGQARLRPRPSSLSTDSHSLTGRSRSVSVFLSENAEYFRWRSCM